MAATCTLVARAPLSHRQVTFLRAHILRQKKKEQGVLINLIKAHQFVYYCITASKERWDKSEPSHSRVTKLGDEKNINVERQRDHVSHQIARGEMIKETEVEAPGDIDIQVSSQTTGSI